MNFSLYEEEMNDLTAYFDKTTSSIVSMRDEFNSNFLSLTNIGLGDFGFSVLLSQMDNMVNSLNGLKKTIKNNVDSFVEEENMLLKGIDDAIVIDDIDSTKSNAMPTNVVINEADKKTFVDNVYKPDIAENNSFGPIYSGNGDLVNPNN